MAGPIPTTLDAFPRRALHGNLYPPISADTAANSPAKRHDGAAPSAIFGGSCPFGTRAEGQKALGCSHVLVTQWGAPGTVVGV
jgi:hypothetical protein